MANSKAAPKTEAPVEKEVSPYAAQQVNKGDSAHIKRLLDEVASEVVLEHGYQEDHLVSNVKIALGVVTCALALVAQFYPVEFPDNKGVLMVCVIGYFFFNTLLQVFVMIWEKEVIVFTHPKGNATSGMMVSTSLPRFSDMYQVTIADAKEGSPSATEPVVLEKSVTAWFYDDGYLAEDIFRKDVLAALHKYENAEPRKTK